MSNCAVALCPSYKRKTKNTVLYHRFPRDPLLCKTWIARCKRADYFNAENARVCSRHFTVDDYERDLKAELLGITPKKILKSSAIPNINLPAGIESLPDIERKIMLPVSNREVRSLGRETRKRALNTHKSLSPKMQNSPAMAENSSVIPSINLPTEIESLPDTQSDVMLPVSNRKIRSLGHKTRKQTLNTLKPISLKKLKISPAMVDREIQCSFSDTDLRERVVLLEKENKRLNALCCQLRQQKKNKKRQQKKIE